MKTNIYILLILLFSFSFSNAQVEATKVKTENTIAVSDSNGDLSAIINSVTNPVKKEVTVLSTNVTTTLVRSNSDIRVYLNRLRKVDNIRWLFPKINKARVA